MRTSSRGLRETVVRGLAKVGLVWALAVLGMLFVVVSAHGGPAGPGDPSGSSVSTFAFAPAEAPRTAGLALALAVLFGGLPVLAIGALRGGTDEPGVDADSDPAPSPTLWLGLDGTAA